MKRRILCHRLGLGGGIADMAVLGLAECGLAGWLLKKPLSAEAVCPADMNPAEDFAHLCSAHFFPMYRR